MGPVLGEEVIPLLKYQFGFFFSSCGTHNFQPCMPSDSKETSNLPDEKQNMIRTVYKILQTNVKKVLHEQLDNETESVHSCLFVTVYHFS